MVPAGCATIKANRSAINVTQTVTTTVKASVDGWLKYVVERHKDFRRRAALGEDVSWELADLTSKEAQVEAAYTKYTETVASLQDVVVKAYEVGDKKAIQQAKAIAVEAGSEVIRLVKIYRN